jgi:hypothetical protein
MMYETTSKNNGKTLFCARDIVCDNHIKNLLDVEALVLYLKHFSISLMEYMLR